MLTVLAPGLPLCDYISVMPLSLGFRVVTCNGPICYTMDYTSVQPGCHGIVNIQ